MNLESALIDRGDIEKYQTPFARLLRCSRLVGERHVGANAGAHTYVERINIRSNTFTRDETIRREFEIAEGDACNRGLVDRAERRLQLPAGQVGEDFSRQRFDAGSRRAQPRSRRAAQRRFVVFGRLLDHGGHHRQGRCFGAEPARSRPIREGVRRGRRISAPRQHVCRRRGHGARGLAILLAPCEAPLPPYGSVLTSPRIHTRRRPAARRDTCRGTAGSTGPASWRRRRPNPIALRCTACRPPRTTPARR
jgi:hypothetical protein